MRSLLVICLLSFVLAASAQQTNEIYVGRADSLLSKVLHEQRRFWVHLPPSARNGEHPKKRYPVVYLLDAEWNFVSVSGMIDFESTINGNNFWPELVVIGIININRFKDLTPTKVISGLWVDSASGKRSGGGELFMTFIEKELMPHIDSLYPVIPYRILIGHSLGGITTINTLVHHKSLFSGYVAVDPSMWWDNQRLLHESEQAFRTTSFAGSTLFLAMAHTQPPGLDTTTLQRDTSEGTIHSRGILELSRFLQEGRQNGLEADFKYYDDETHASLPLIAVYDGLHFIFKYYPIHFQDSYFTDPSFHLASFIEDHYKKVGSKYHITMEDGRPALPPEDLLDNVGFFVMGKKEYDKAESLFNLSIKNYPSSPLAYGYLGDLYAAKDNKASAIENYKKSLSIKENVEMRKKLEKLMGK